MAGADVDDEDLLELEFDPYAFIKSLPPLEQCAPAWRRCLLPKQTRQCKRKTLVRRAAKPVSMSVKFEIECSVQVLVPCQVFSDPVGCQICVSINVVSASILELQRRDAQPYCRG